MQVPSLTAKQRNSVKTIYSLFIKFLAVFYLFQLLYCSTSSIKESENLTGMVPIKETQDRIKNQVEFFKKEYKIIQAKRQFYKINYPANSFNALAFSGGGIRSNAFQLGLLMGLAFEGNNPRLKERGLLKHIDYISAVSGGSWAAGSFKSYPGESNHFLKEINKIAEDEFKSYDKDSFSSILLSFYKGNMDFLNFKRKIYPDFLRDFLIGDSHTREQWRQMIQWNYLRKNDVSLEDLEPNLDEKKSETIKENQIYQRPFLIINASHSSSINTQKKSFPFELTALGFGTIADCGNTDYCNPLMFSSNKGFFIKNKEYLNAKLYLSHALAMSSAITPSQICGFSISEELEWHLRIPSSKETKDSYVITDGGHAENLGVIPLLERGVKNIIISDASEISKNNLADFDILVHHAEKLLGVKISTNEQEKEEVKRGNRYIFNANAVYPDGRVANLYYFRMVAKDDFFQYLYEDKNKHYIYNYLKLNSTNFPRTQTITLEYPPELLKAYYFLGRFIGEKHIKTEYLK